MFEKIAKIAAKLYSGRDWHKLSQEERGLVKSLEESGLITLNSPANGFVGRVA